MSEGTRTETGEQGERLFTQAELDKIINGRLARLKSERSKEAEEEAEAKAAEIAERQAALEKSERRSRCLDYLRKEGYPETLADVLDTSDIEAFTANAKNVYDSVAASIPADDRIVELTRRLIAKEYGIPDELSGRLRGQTEEEIRADAESFGAYMRQAAPRMPLASSEPTITNKGLFSVESTKHKPKGI